MSTTFDDYAASGISGLDNPFSAASLVQLIDADTVSLYLDDIVFADRGIAVGESEDHADFLITLITQDDGTDPGGPGNRLPEPATLALVLGSGSGRRFSAAPACLTALSRWRTSSLLSVAHSRWSWTTRPT